MKPKSENTSSSATRPSERSVSGKDLFELFEAHRLASAELYAEIRKMLAENRNVLQTPPPREHARLRTLYDKAFLLSRQAEAKIELLLSGFRGRS
jgi:hypothetical protein